jgi:hypothetical protein
MTPPLILKAPASGEVTFVQPASRSQRLNESYTTTLRACP